MSIDLILDRVEGDVAVLTDDSLKVYECSAALLPLDSKEGAAFLGEIDDNGNVVSLEKSVNPTAGQNRRRLMALFNKNPKNKTNR